MSAVTSAIADHCVERFCELINCAEGLRHDWKDGKCHAPIALHGMEWYLTSVHVLANELIVLLRSLDAADDLSRTCIVVRSQLAMTEIADHIHAVRKGAIERAAELYLAR